MGEIDFRFQPTVPAFDANIALGRRHDRRVAVDTLEGTLEAMKAAGVGRAVAYAPHAVERDPTQGNEILIEAIDGRPELFPQFAFNPTWDDFDSFAKQVADLNVRSVRMTPGLHNYPFRDWVVGQWLEWLAAENIPAWMPECRDDYGTITNIDPEALHDTMEAHPDVKVVLSEVQYGHQSWAVPMLRSLPNLHVEISRMINTDEVSRVVGLIGEERVLFGSRFPDAAISPHLYWLHRCGFSESTLKAICSENLERLLGLG